ASSAAGRRSFRVKRGIPRRAWWRAGAQAMVKRLPWSNWGLLARSAIPALDEGHLLLTLKESASEGSLPRPRGEVAGGWAGVGCQGRGGRARARPSRFLNAGRIKYRLQ